jgi:lambda family phage portal protein
VFVLNPYRKREGNTYGLTLQFIEADRVCNQYFALNTQKMAFGIEKDDDGAPVKVWIANRHPLSMIDSKQLEWNPVPVYSPRTKRRQVLHVTRPLRPGQTRGIPYLTPVIETLKQLARYTEAELQAAVVAGLFTVFIKTETGEDGPLPMPATNTTTDDTKDEVKLGPGAVVGLAENETIETANPSRPNSAFDPFVLSLCRYIGIALEIPVEVLIKHFMASYSAARAAMQELWKFVVVRRQWLVTNYCQPVYEWWMDEAVATGRIAAPGYFEDPIIRQAYLRAKWTGPAKGMIQEKQEVEAAILRVNNTLSSKETETAELTGGDYDMNCRQRGREVKQEKKQGLAPEPTPPLFGEPGASDQGNTNNNNDNAANAKRIVGLEDRLQALEEQNANY